MLSWSRRDRAATGRPKASDAARVPDPVDLPSMDDADRLAAGLTGVTCTACGRAVPPGRVSVVARREALAFLVVDCPRCASRTLGLMTWDGVEGERTAAFDLARRGEFGPADEARFEDARPIDVDDVMSMHTFLAGYEGDLRGLLDDGASDIPRGFGTG